MEPQEEILHFDIEWSFVDCPTSTLSRLRTEHSLLGRKHSETMLLERLIRKGSKPVKKEYLRIQLIRSHKRRLRQLKHLGRRPRRLPSSLDQKLLEVFDANRPVFNKLLSPRSGPLTDGAGPGNKPCSVQKTWNNASCTQYFGHPAVRESFYYFTESIFEGMCPVKLAEYFKARCCDQPVHSAECNELWTQIKHFVQEGLLLSLGLSPFEPYSGPEWAEVLL